MTEVIKATITSVSGGYYDITHPSLSEPVRVQGKEKADARAEEIEKAAEPAEGKMEQQGDLPDDASLLGTAGTAGAEDAAAAKAKAEEDAKRIAELEEQLAAARANAADEAKRANELEKAAEPLVRTVHVDEAPAENVVPASVPRSFAGQMSKETKALLKKQGIGFKTIVLEENDSIPPTGLFVGHNGKSYMIKPGEEVDVPDFITDLLDDAVMSAPMVDASTQKVLGYRDRSKYPYRVINK